MRPMVILGVGGAAVAAVLLLLVVRHEGSGGAAPPGLDALLANLPPGITVSHGEVTFSPMAGNADLRAVVVQKFGRTVFSADEVKVTGIAGLSLDAAPAMIGHVTVINAAIGKAYPHIGRIEIDRLAAETLRQIVTPSSYPAGKPAWVDFRPVVGRVDMFDIAGHADAPPHQNGKIRITGSDFSIAHSKAVGITARQLEAAPTDEAFDDPAYAGDILRAFNEESAAVEQMRLSFHGLGDLTVADFKMAGFTAGKIADAQIDEIAFTADGDAGTAKLHGFRIQGLDFDQALAQLPAILQAQQAHLPPPNVGRMMTLSDFNMAGLSADFHHAPKIAMDSFVEHVDHAGSIDTATAAVHNLAVSFTGRDIPPKASRELQIFGMQDFNVDLDVASTSDLQAGKMALTRYDTIFHGLGTLHMTFAMENYFPGGGTAADMQSRIRQARLVQATVKWDDDSLTSRIYKLVEADTGRTEAEVKATAALPLAALSRFVPEQADAGDQIKAFLDGQHSLSFIMEPKVPISFGELGGAAPEEKASMLGLRISGN